MTITATDLAELLRARGDTCTRQQAALFLADWAKAGITREVLPGHYQLTDRGRQLGGSLIPFTDHQDCSNAARAACVPEPGAQGDPRGVGHERMFASGHSPPHLSAKETFAKACRDE